MSEAVVVGYFSDSIESGALTGVDLELRALELVAHWRRCGHTADWLARFFSYDFDLETREAATSVLSR